MGNKKAIEIIYKGIIFRRYPKAKTRTERVYYIPSQAYRKKGIGRLHQEIWKDKYGKIPKGYVIHHKDGNSENNDIENLECIPRGSHQSKHTKEYNKKNRKKVLEHLNKIRPMSKEWHKTKEGKKLHKENVKYLQNRKYKKNCFYCKEEYISKTKKGKYCSKKCLSADRRESGIDNEKRKCVKCGDVFEANKYSEKNIVGIKPVKEKVYNLTVKDQHEYFANRILVSNCHANNYSKIGFDFFVNTQRESVVGIITDANKRQDKLKQQIITNPDLI